MSAITSWQRANVQAAAIYLREQIGLGATDPRTRSIYEGLLEVLDPTRRATRVQRELHGSAKAAVTVPTGRERRSVAIERRRKDRRVVNLGPTGVERRAGVDRRNVRDRRRRG